VSLAAERIVLRTTAPGPGYFVGKRALDLAGSAALLVLLAPAIAAIALAIRLDSPGPALYRQERIGGRRRRTPDGDVWEAMRFRIVKFRSMRADVDDTAHRAYVAAFVAGAPPGAGRVPFKLEGDPRVTRVGALLRRTSADELPQLWCVLAGTMSLVGPRPVPPYEVAAYRPEDCERLAAKAGITGAWQVHGRGRVGFAGMVALDIDYVRHRSLRRDVALLAQTAAVVLSGRGAA
jgi:lipopolysaccharide/colanic/teichoic acid biosynthesis glycosyltransferase